MANTVDVIRNKMQQINDTSQNKPIGPQLYKGEALPANVGNLGLMNQIDNIYNRNTTSSASSADSSVSPYVSKVNEAISSTSGNAQPIIDKPVVDEGKIKQDAYNQGVADNKAEYAKNTSGMMTTEQATKMSEDQRAAEAEAIRAKVRAAIAQGTQAQNKIINDAPAQFVDPMNRASFQGARNSQAIDERMVAMGLGRSGSNITAQTSNNNQTAANINDLENAKAKVITDAQQAIANLEASGSLQEVQLVQEAAKASLERLQNQINIIDNRKNEQATAIFNNANNALKTSYDIGANEKQLGMQERTTDASITGIDAKTGLPTADMQKFTKTFDATEAQRLFENAFKTASFDYQNTRDTIEDNRYDERWKQELDNIAWSRSENNPTVKSQIISNMINDLNLTRMQDPESPENQMRYTQAKSAVDALNKQMAITPEMTVKQYNAGLDQIYQSIAASKANTAQGQASVNNAADVLKLNKDKFAWDKDPNNPDNILKLSTANGTKMTATEQKNANVAQLTQKLDAMTPENKKKFLSEQKYNIIKDLGNDTYNSIYNQSIYGVR